MSDVRTRVADALRQHSLTEPQRKYADFVADKLLSLAGIAIVELPEYNEEYECFSGGGYPCNGDPEHVCGAKGGMVRAGLPKYMPPRVARSVAAALLAAANAAEIGDPNE